MGFLTVAGKNRMLDALAGTASGSAISHVGLLTKGANITGVTSTGSPDTFTKTSHGLSNGDLVVASSISGGTGLVAGFPYFIVSTATNTFQLALTSGGAAIDLSADLTSATFNKLTEISGGSPAYARKPQAYAAAAASLIDDSTNGAVFDVPAGGVVDYHGFYTASTAGTLMAVDDVTQEVFGAQGTYTVTDTKQDLRESGGLG
ncbi:MAG TPA: hypothetical protein VFG87_15265 [Amycolatopsis sp.]|jgi:hypothetical protein|nr:hypothetical protein [Amycolatopsis sp.]